MIEAENVSVHFKAGLRRGVLKALDGLDLRVEEGDFFALLGQNGAGKSTAMYCLLGLLRPTTGRVNVLGRTPEPGSELYRSIGYLPEEPHYHDYLGVEEAIRYYASLYGDGIPQKRLEDLLERLGLAEFRRLPLRKCSKGMKQKVGIAQCLLSDARLLFLDEPMRGLDPLAVRDFRDILVELNHGGTTIVMNSHILSEVEMVANRAAIIHRGRVLVQDDLRHLLEVNASEYVVEVENHPDLPAPFVHEIAADGSARGTVPADRLYELLDFVRERALTLRSCVQRRATLEESFMSILKEDGPSA